MVLVISQMGISQSVDEFIDMATTYSPDLKSLKLEYEAAGYKADQVDDWADPTVSLGLGVLPVETRLGAQRFKVGVSQMVPWKGLLDAKRNLALSQAEMKRYSNEVKEIDIEYMIRNLYSSLLYLDRQQLIFAERLEVLEALAELAKSGVRSGKGKLSNVLFVERQREAIAADIELLTAQKRPLMIRLNVTAGRAIDATIDLVLQESVVSDTAQQLFYITQDHPSLKALDTKITASQQAAKLTKYEAKPKIGIGLDYAWIDGRNDVNIPGNGRDILMPMGSISIPLNKSKYESKRKQESLVQEAAIARKSDLKDTFRKEIESTQADLEYLNKKIEKFRSLTVITTETLKLLRIEYATEGSRFEELLRLEMELIDYKDQILQAEYQKDLKTAILMKYK